MNQSSELTLATHLFQQLQLWKAPDFGGKFFLLTVAKVFCIFLKPGLHISCKDYKHDFKLSPYALVSSCNDSRYSYFTRQFKTLFN